MWSVKLFACVFIILFSRFQLLASELDFDSCHHLSFPYEGLELKSMRTSALYIIYVPPFFYLLMRRSISDHNLRNCGYVTCSRPQRTATGGFEPRTPRPKVLSFTTAPVRSSSLCHRHLQRSLGFSFMKCHCVLTSLSYSSLGRIIGKSDFRLPQNKAALSPCG